MVRDVREGDAAGRRVPCLMAERLEDRLEDELDPLRQELGLPVTEPA